MKIFEIIMLVMFGISWPVSIVKSYTSRKNGSKSVFFLVCIMIGYASGIVNKVLNNFDYVTYLYMLNLIMVAIDTCLYFRNRKLENR